MGRVSIQPGTRLPTIGMIALRILMLEKDAALLALVRAQLAADGLECDPRHVEDRAGYVAALQAGGWDLILAGAGGPGLDPASALALAQVHCPRVPVIVVTKALPAEAAIELIKTGAADCVFKDSLARLGPAVHRALREAAQAREAAANLETHDRFRMLAEAAPVMMWLSGQARGCTYFNQRWLDFTGRTLEQELGDGWLGGVHPDDRERCLRDDQAAFAAHREVRLEYRLRRADGQYRWVMDQGQPHFAPDGTFAGYVGVCLDIHERREMEAALRVSEARFSRTFALSPLALTITRLRDGRLVEVNAAFEALSGYTRAEALGRTPDELNLWVMPGQRAEGLARLRAGEVIANLEATFRRKDGALCTCLLGAGLVELDDEPCAVTALIDITLRKQAEAEAASQRQAVEAERARLRAMFDQTLVGVAQTDLTGRFVMVNQRYAEITGRPPEELLGLRMQDITHPDDLPSNAELFGRMVADGTGFVIEKRYVRPDGTAVWVRNSVSRVMSPDGAPQYTLAIVQDITEAKAADEERAGYARLLEARVAERTAELRRLSAYLEQVREEERTRIAREIHDELGQQLTGLKMDVVKLRGRLEAERAGLGTPLGEVILAIDGTIRTVRRLASELRPSLLDDFGLRAAIEAQLADFGRRSGIAYELDVTADEARIDPERRTAFFRIFQETLTNVMRHAEASRVRVTLQECDGRLVMQVSDNGRGISDEALLGSQSLGLLGMRERARLLAGELTIAGVPGQGTTVTVKVPLQQPGD